MAQFVHARAVYKNKRPRCHESPAFGGSRGANVSESHAPELARNLLEILSRSVHLETGAEDEGRLFLRHDRGRGLAMRKVPATFARAPVRAHGGIVCHRLLLRRLLA